VITQTGLLCRVITQTGLLCRVITQTGLLCRVITRTGFCRVITQTGLLCYITLPFKILVTIGHFIVIYELPTILVDSLQNCHIRRGRTHSYIDIVKYNFICYIHN